MQMELHDNGIKMMGIENLWNIRYLSSNTGMLLEIEKKGDEVEKIFQIYLSERIYYF